MLLHEYVVVVPSLPDSVTAEEVLETYRRRWQVGIRFKRLKSILDFGDLPKKNPTASQAWSNGKITAALLIEAFTAKASFSPVTRSNTGRSIWRETAFVTLVLRANLGLRIG
jgi:hypothetical protein